MTDTEHAAKVRACVKALVDAIAEARAHGLTVEIADDTAFAHDLLVFPASAATAERIVIARQY